MCCSRIGQILYGIAMLVALALTVAGMLTPGWQEIDSNGSGTTTQTPTGTIRKSLNLGLFSFSCAYETDGKNTPESVKNGQFSCEDWWKNQPLWQKIVIGLLCGAILVEIFALVYNFITFCCCCCRGHALKPLAPLAILAAILVGAAVVVFAIKNKDALEENKNLNDFRNSDNAVGYSFFLECGAVAILIANAVVGAITVWFGDKCL